MNKELENWQEGLQNEWRDFFSTKRSDRFWNVMERVAMALFIALMALLASCVGYDEMHVLPSANQKAEVMK